jgi:23S rRNA pseudouridine1911/1915/1917 synthase
LKTNSIKLSSPATREFWEIPILFEDEHLLALDKSAGVLTSPESFNPSARLIAKDEPEVERPNLMQLLHAGIKDGKPWARERNLDYLNNANRLDFDTSGILLLAKSKPVFIALADLFGMERPLKKFLTLARGTPSENKFEVDAPLAPHPLKLGAMRVDADNGKKSKTIFTVLENFPRHGYALLQCEPITTRTHQIRVHLRQADLSVVGDDIYGGKPLWLSRLKQDYRLKPGREERALISRVALHAGELSLPHPITKETVTIKSELPKDFKVALKYLRQYSA